MHRRTWKIDFTVHVENNTGRHLSNAVMKVGLYSLDLHQEIVKISQTPPAKIKMGGEKNYYALVKVKSLSPNEIFTYKLSLVVKTTAMSFFVPPFKLEEYPPQILRNYTTGTTFWETFSPKIKQVANGLFLKSGNDLNQYIRNTFLFVNQEIKLKQPLMTRFGASKALMLHEGDCDELSDLFITLLRVNRIPARRIVGYFLKIKSKEDIVAEPHAWAEVYFPTAGWVSFDPALGYYARISSSHFVRAKLGLVSDKPLYSIKWKGKKDDSLTISNEEVNVSLLE
ncbi:MAG: transglutaminase family protein [Candidatus Odinarchaeota archaeon]|nr:transglutaminase family protein [Candidatus Odinarchaeota archaeon]